MTPIDNPTSTPAGTPAGDLDRLTAIDQLTLHLQCDLAAPDLDDLATEIEALTTRAEAAEAALVEMARRRDAWRQKAAGYDELAAAVRKGVADAGPRDLGRIFLRGALVEQAHRIDDLQAIVAKVAAGPAWGDSTSRWCDRMMLDARAALPASQPTAAPASPPAES